MMEKKNDKEKILLGVKDVCRKYNITRKTLFYYDKTGLVKPSERVGSQQAKMYDIFSLKTLEGVLAYRNAGLMIEEIREMMKPHMNMMDYVRILERARERLEKEKEQKEQEIRNLDVILANYERLIHGNKK